LQVLEAFASVWDNLYPQISRSWQANWANLATFFHYPADIRKVIHYVSTTNAIESLNSVICQAIKKFQVFLTDNFVKKGGAGHLSGLTEMEDAAEGLAQGDELLYYQVRRQPK